ncbi:MAG: hypothetical protein LBB67_04210 [Oscillospiraceae bacterium]|jgi:stage III sporulation protein AE|nr:hypothetical protein [Oscillospiraceae bacterium]
MKRLKFAIALVSCLAGLAFCLRFGVSAQTAEDDSRLPPGYEEQLEASSANRLFDALPDDTQDALAGLGLDGIDFYKVLEASPRNILDTLFNLLQGGVSKILQSGALALAIVLLLSFASSALPDDEKPRHAVEAAGGILSILMLLPGLSELMRGASEVVKVGSDFSLLLIPILAGIITAAGNPALALSYHTLTFAAAQGLAQLTDGVVVPCTSVVLGLTLVDSAAKDTQLSAIAGLIKKTVIGAFAVLASLFSALLSIKSLIANTADALVLRGVKVVAGSVPLVGGALSEACGAILSSVALVKSTVGGFALIASLILYAPILIELLLWSFMLKILGATGDLFNQNGVSQVFKSVQYAVSILMACVLLNAALLAISTGLVLTMKGNA